MSKIFSLPHAGEQFIKLREHLSSLPDADDLIFLSTELLRKAPADFLSRNSIETLTEIIKQTNEFYQKFLKSEKEFLIEITNFPEDHLRASYSTITIAISDRPFVVDTTIELLRKSGLQSQVILHPIIRDTVGRRTSFTYIEVEKITDDTLLNSLKNSFNQTLNDLLLVTNDFREIHKRAEEIARYFELSPKSVSKDNKNFREYSQFVYWLADGGLVFLGFREWEMTDDIIAPINSSDLGLFRSTSPEYSSNWTEIHKDICSIISEQFPLNISKLKLKSSVHRNAYIDIISIETTSDTGKKCFQTFIGLFTSKASAQEYTSIPLIRQKINKLIKLEDLLPNSYDYKEVISIINSIPKSDVFLYEVKTLRRIISTVMGVKQYSTIKLNLWIDPLRRFVWLVVILPSERFASDSNEIIIQYIEKVFNLPSEATEYKIAVTDDQLVRIHYLLPCADSIKSEIDLKKLEQEIIGLTNSWDDNLFTALQKHKSKTTALKFIDRYSASFPEHYKASTDIQTALFDINHLELLSVENPLELALLSPSSNDDTLFTLKLYSREENLTLSSIVPFLENVGFNIVNEQVTSLSQQANNTFAVIYDLQVRPRQLENNQCLLLDTSAPAVSFLLSGLKSIFAGQAENDQLNCLMLLAGLTLEEVAIVRTFQHYLWQIQAFPSELSIIDAIIENPGIVKTLVEYFKTRFDPNYCPTKINDHDSYRLTKLNELNSLYNSQIKSVRKLLHDRILRALLNLISSTVRTNFFRNPHSLRVAIKIDCKKVAFLPEPRPLFEIFINSPDFEGVHLRGGKVARGGIRWSERPEDYRMEIFGLMKTQTIKNSIIIPVGAKGGFVLKKKFNTPGETQIAVQESYRQFIRSLLELTDNRIGNSIVHPPNTVIHDGPDAYLVVAADKGTAAFSDTANEIAVNEFNFWLGDAFASGGSNGYDHKKLAITARGAWVAVCGHFREIGINIEKNPFTVVGIGDMSGDVFGNGLLLSKNAKLIGAFDHRHIFIDPHPDPGTSYNERKRLFELPRSQWTDYDHSLLSMGGGIYPRQQKEIQLSPEAAKVLGLKTSIISGSELVQALLQAPVDLIWNGGIGTYVKSSQEDNNSVGDRSNDEVRVDARNLRAKVVAEGGNLGFTQLARIEYSKIGGHINTDAVDNCGGVSLSDSEVNIKILLSRTIERKALSLIDRNTLLQSLSTEVCDKVLARNYSQINILSLGVHKSRKDLDSYSAMIRSLEKEGRIDRQTQFLPNEETLSRRSKLKAGLTRPELAILVSSARMSLFEAIIESNLPDDEYTRHYLISYFPKTIIENFIEDALEHPLRREIIATQIANVTIERVGSNFIQLIAEETSTPRAEVIAAFLTADTIAGGQTLTDKLAIIDRPESSRIFIRSLLQLRSSIATITNWLLDHKTPEISWASLAQKYRASFSMLVNNIGDVLTEAELLSYNEAYQQLTSNKFPDALAKELIPLSYSVSFLEIINLAKTNDLPLQEVAKVYGNLNSNLQINRLLDQTNEILPTDHWEALAQRSLASQIRTTTASITNAVIAQEGKASLENVSQYLQSKKTLVDQYHQNLHETQGRAMSIPALLVIANQLKSLAR